MAHACDQKGGQEEYCGALFGRAQWLCQSHWPIDTDRVAARTEPRINGH